MNIWYLAAAGLAALTILAIQYFSFAVLFVFSGLVRFNNLNQMPQWSVFIVVPVLIFLARRSAERNLAKA